MLNLTPAEIDLVRAAEDIDTKDVLDEIYKFSSVSWEHPLREDDVMEWLSNFNGHALGSAGAERNLATWLLSGFVYFSLDDVRNYCKDIFKEFLHTKLAEYHTQNLYQELTTAEQIAHVLDNTLFLALGNKSESGSNILYYFRQDNALGTSLFDLVEGKTYENVVFIDDVTLSGIQAMKYISEERTNVSANNCYLLTFLATQTAIGDITPMHVHVLCANILSEREQCFSEESYIFASSSRKIFLPIARKMCEYYGNIITAGHPEVNGFPLGIDQVQGLFCFFYNTPDNTLPIFWCNQHGWKPIFKRYEKIIDKAVHLNDSQYV